MTRWRVVEDEWRMGIEEAGVNARGIRRTGLPGRPSGSRVAASQAEVGRQVGRRQSPRRWACGASREPDVSPNGAGRKGRRRRTDDRWWRGCAGCRDVRYTSTGHGDEGLQPRLAVLRRCRVSSGTATCPATISRPVRAGHKRGVGGRRSGQGRVLRPGVGAASTSERGRAPRWLRANSPPAAYPSTPCTGRRMEAPRRSHPLRRLRHRARRSGQRLSARGDGGRAETATGERRPSRAVETASRSRSVTGKSDDQSHRRRDGTAHRRVRSGL